MSRKKSTSKIPDNQLSFFDQNGDIRDQRPLPEIIASGGKDWNAFPLQKHDQDGKRFYAVQDWIRGIALTNRSSKFWNDLKTRLIKANIETSAWCGSLPYVANDNKTYQRDYATAEGLYIITQRMNTNTGIRDKVLAYLAKSGVKLDEYRLDNDKMLQDALSGSHSPDNDPNRPLIQAQTTVHRKTFTDAIGDWFQNPDYPGATNAEYIGLFKRTASQLCDEFKVKHGTNLRNLFPSIALLYIGIVEQSVAQEIGNRETLTWSECLKIIKSIAEFIRPQVEAYQKRFGIDVPTGQKLLKPKH